MTPDELLNLLSQHRSKYTEDWQRTAAHSDANGDYLWMSEFVKGHALVLEIGVGDGTSTLRLLEKNHRVVAIDSNDKCLLAARERLSEHHDVRLIEREDWNQDGGQLNVQYAPIKESLPEDTTLLVNGDVTNDPELQAWLRSVGPFDAIVCWLIGTNMVDLSRHREDGDTQPEPERYRCKVQNRVYELGDQVLRPGGIVHVVDRFESPSEASRDKLLEEILETHLEQVSVTNLVVDEASLEVRPWHSPEDGITMKRSSGLAETATDLLLVSIVSRKPL